MKLKINDFEIEEQGTVRAALALSALGVASYALVNGLAATEWLIALMAGVVYYYFEKKADIPTSASGEQVDGSISFKVNK